MISESSKMMMVTGLARSGTTLLAECLDHHPCIMCIADPMNEFFKGFIRYAYYRVENEKKSVGYPIDNFFFSGSKRVSQFIDETDLRHGIPGYLKEEILTRIAVRDGEYCLEIVDPVQRCQAESFDSLFLEIMELLYDTYGEPGTVCFGIKTAWCEQLIQPLARTFPNMVFVNIIRDPRAVVASNYVFEEARYPLLLNVRDWRKSVYYSWKYQYLDPLLSDRFVWTRYEDLIEKPKDVLSMITDLVGVEYDEAMVRQPFKKPNTSYKDLSDSNGISTRFKEKWKDVLPKDIVLQIEAYCAAEMRKLNYERMYPEVQTDIGTLMSLEDVPYESLSGWCKELVQGKEHYEGTWLTYNTLLEAIRLVLIDDPSGTEGSRLLDEFFYQRDYFLWLRDNKATE
jgi:hypothetical protein